MIRIESDVVLLLSPLWLLFLFLFLGIVLPPFSIPVFGVAIKNRILVTTPPPPTTTTANIYILGTSSLGNYDSSILGNQICQLSAVVVVVAVAAAVVVVVVVSAVVVVAVAAVVVEKAGQEPTVFYYAVVLLMVPVLYLL